MLRLGSLLSSITVSSVDWVVELGSQWHGLVWASRLSG